jgi:hypothetical protein
MPVTSTKPEVNVWSPPNRSPWLIALESTLDKIAATTALVGTVAALLQKLPLDHADRQGEMALRPRNSQMKAPPFHVSVKDTL